MVFEESNVQAHFNDRSYSPGWRYWIYQEGHIEAFVNRIGFEHLLAFCAVFCFGTGS
jgi:hypothetical protein